MVISVASEANWRFRSLSCMISASILRSPSSSRRRCVSIRRFSRSCSPTLISSSIMTARSIETLNFDSKSSSEEDVFLACRSKSSFATSISRKRCCKVLFWSRSVVISFCRVFCAAPASIFDCLYLVYDMLVIDRSHQRPPNRSQSKNPRYRIPSTHRPQTPSPLPSLVVRVPSSPQPLHLSPAPPPTPD